MDISWLKANPVNKHGACSIPRKTLGLRPNDQRCHHETWLHIDFDYWSNTWSNKGDYDRHISLKERPADYSYATPKRRISDVIPFALVVILRPFAHDVRYFAKQERPFTLVVILRPFAPLEQHVHHHQVT